jgi:hypothetical protein
MTKLSAKVVFTDARDIEVSLLQGVGAPSIGDQSNELISGAVGGDMQWQCAMGNQAACE